MSCIAKDKIITAATLAAQIKEPWSAPVDFNSGLEAKKPQYEIESRLSVAREKAKLRDKPNTLVEKLLDFSKVVFSRESTYRGFVDLFAEDTPALLAEALRGKAAFIESTFKHILTTGMIFTSPLITKFFAKYHANKIFSEDESKNFANLMLFSREDLDSNQNFDRARERIIKEETQDKVNLAEMHGFDSSKAQTCIQEAKSMQDFMQSYQASDELRSKISRLKDETIRSQIWLESAFWGGMPLLKRLFRKYILGVDRFVGSMKYLSDKDADKLGNQKFFTPRQIFGTIVSMLSGPAIVNSILGFIKKLQPGAKTGLGALLKRQMDTKHSFFPKIGLFMSYSEIPFFMSKIINAQDMFERIENLIKFFVTFSSLMFGDRATNGKFAQKVDQEFTQKHGLKPGVFYEKVADDKRGFWASLSRVLPEASKYQHVLNRTSHDPKLEQEATKIYQNTFFKGFVFHSIGTFLLKTFINWTTKFRVKAALAQ